MAMKCPICGAENPEGQKFCGDCGSRMPDTVPQVPVSTVEAHDVRGMSFNRKKVAIAAIVVVVVLIVIAASLAYYYQPVRGTGFVSSTTVLLGQSVRFDFTPSQGVGPFSYEWSFGDGTHSLEKNPTHTYDASGTWTVRVTVTGGSGKSCTWSTTITVRLPLVFIHTISYPAMLKNPLGDTQLWLYVNGNRVGADAALNPNTTYNIELKVVWVIDFGIGTPQYNTMSDEKGTVTSPNTAADLYCRLTLSYDSYGKTKFTLTAA